MKMQKTSVLTIDLGSSSLRVSAHCAEKPWKVLKTIAKKYRVFKPRDPNSLSSRFSEEELWNRVSSMVSEITKPTTSTEIISVVVTSQRGGLALLDKLGKAIHLAPNTDLRAVFEAMALEKLYGSELYKSTGHVPALMFAPAKVQWWKNHHPRITSRVSKVTSLATWLTYKLAGEITTVPTDLSELGLLNPETRSLPAEVLKTVGFDENYIPVILEEGTSIGRIKSSVANLLGISPKAQIFLAGSDTHSAFLGTGMVNPGESGVVAGWSGPVHLTCEKPIFDKLHRTMTGPSLSPSRSYIEANSGAIGGTVDVIRTLLGDRASLSRFDRLLAKSRRNSNYVVASLGPHALDLSNPGMSMGGLLFPIPLTHHQLLPAHIARATVENIAFAIKDCIGLCQEVSQSTIAGPFTLTGGFASSSIFGQLLSDVLNKPVRKFSPLGSSIGSAVVGSIDREDWASASTELKQQSILIEPDVRGVIEYKEGFERWKKFSTEIALLIDSL